MRWNIGGHIWRKSWLVSINLFGNKKQFTELNPSEAKKLGRRVKLRKDWEAVKVKIMEELVRAKFTQNPDLADKLLATGDAYLESKTMGRNIR